MQRGHFICPRCGKQELKENAVIHSIEISSDVDLSRGYNPYMTKIVTKYYNIRFCKACHKHLTMNHYLRHVLWFLLPMVVFNFFVKEISFGTIAFPIGLSFFLHPLAISLYRDIKMKFPYTKNLIKRAKEGNAVV